MFSLSFGVYGKEFKGDLPAWLLVLNAFLYFAQRVLDDLDGKQARRTGNSSPLGMLYDHSADSMSTAMITMIFMKMLQIGYSESPIFSMAAISLTVMAFYTQILEEYYTGEFILDFINPVSEGSFMIYFMFIFTAIVGCPFWLNNLTLVGYTFFYAQWFLFILISL
jgi:ethanolaminephosphotransferase